MALNSITSKIKLLSGNYIPLLGFGTYSLKGQVCEDAVKTALQVGYRHIDTGSIFKNQTDIKKAWTSLNLKRSDIYIATKVGPAEQGHKQSIKTCQDIMNKFQTDYLDLVLIHWPGSNKCTMDSQKNKQYRLQTWKGLIQLKSQGKIKDIGVSNFMINHLQHMAISNVQLPSVNQFQVHPLLWQQKQIQFCRSHNIIIQSYSTMGKGDKRILQNQTLKQLALKYNKTVAQICLRWAIQQGFIVIPRSKNPIHIQQNSSIFDFQINKEDMNRINQLRKLNVRINWDGNKVKF